MACDPYMCDLDPDTKTKLKIYLFKNVKNVVELRNNVISGAWKCSVVKPSLVVDPFQITVAANKAVVSQHQGNMVTKSVFVEILFNLSMSKSIAHSALLFGVSLSKNTSKSESEVVEECQDLLISFLVTPEEDCSSQIIPQINGEMCPLSELSNLTNLKEVKSVYKLDNLADNINLLDVIISRIVTKQLFQVIKNN